MADPDAPDAQTVGAALENPRVGDWDGDSNLELFRWNNWWEIEPPKQKKKRRKS